MNTKQEVKKMIEEWRDIPDYEGLYQVSNMGRIKSLDRRIKRTSTTKRNWKGRIMKLAETRGYYTIQLSKNGKVKIHGVHRLVAFAFIENPNNYPVINHKDENPLNNHVDNLEWCTYSYNNSYGTRTKRAIKKFKKKMSKKVYQYTLNGDLIRTWQSAMEAGRNGYNSGNIASCCLGNRKTHKGFMWSYTNLEEEKIS